MTDNLKFPPGTKVKVFAAGSSGVETLGEVTGIRHDGMLFVSLKDWKGDWKSEAIVAHPKQVRRIVKKERRRIWVPDFTLNEEPALVKVYFDKCPGEYFSEFIEVGKKK